MTATLLAVDDSKTMRKVLENTFAGEDYKMVLANSPADALAKLKAERPLIALVDALLGANNGYDLCQQIKAEAPQVGVIVLSSKQHPYDRVKGSSVGADDFIDKPYDSQALIDKVAALSSKLAAAPAVKPAVVAAPAPAPAAAAKPLAPTAAAASATATRTTMSFGAPQGAGSSTSPIKPTQVSASAPQAAPAARHEPPSALGARPAPVATAARPPVPAVTTTAPVTTSSVVAARPAAPAVQAAPPAAPTAGLISAAALIDPSMEGKLTALGLTKDQIAGVLAISREVLEQVVWEVVPVLAETMIREEIQRLTSE